MWVDAVQIQQVVYNLITNALEAIAGSGMSDGRIVISSTIKDDHVQVCVVQDSEQGARICFSLPFAPASAE